MTAKPDVVAIRERAAAATPGPWAVRVSVFDNGDSCDDVIEKHGNINVCSECDETTGDGLFIRFSSPGYPRPPRLRRGAGAGGGAAAHGYRTHDGHR